MITLAWPPKELNPNCKIHWAKKAKAIKAYRVAAGWATKISGEKISGDGLIDLHITFYPPDRHHRDDDNILASFKAGRDGIADALGINDNRFRARCEIGSVIKGGQVRVILTGEICQLA